MKIIPTALFFILLSIIGYSQHTPEYEQIALDNFLDSVLVKSNEDIKRIIIYENVVDKVTQFTLSRDCFKRDNIYQKLSENVSYISKDARIVLNINNDKLQNLKIREYKGTLPNWKKPYVYAKHHNVIGELFYVEIVFNTGMFYVQYYYEIEKDGNIKDVCSLSRT